MKHSTLTNSLLIAMALGATASAQAQVFQLNEEKSAELSPVHRSTPIIGDVNNDGTPDFYYGGQGFEGADSKWAWEDPETKEKLDLNWLTSGYLYQSTAPGKWTWSRYIGARSPEGDYSSLLGLPPSTFNYGRWLDFNNDGLLDIYLTGKNEMGFEPAENVGDQMGFYTYLMKNEGGKFTFADISTFPTGDNEKNLPSMNNSSLSFGDYNNDGYTDILIQCMKRWAEDGDDGRVMQYKRLLALYKNNGDGTFTEQHVFNPIPYEQNPMPTDLFEADVESGTMKPTMIAKPMSHGATIMGDLNNDGWLDIVASGYSNDGPCFYIYKNNGDGTFQELDLKGKAFVPVYESDLALADVNNDGWLDIVSFGTDPTPNSPKRGDIFLNNCDGDFNFTLSSVDAGNGIYGSAESTLRLVDINHDGLVDIIDGGWTNVDNKQWGTRIQFQNPDGTFSLQQTLRHFDGGAYEVADLNGDGAIDLIGDGYGFSIAGSNSTAYEYYDGLCTDNIQAPVAPTDVKAESTENGKLTVRFVGDEFELGNAYNVYVKNKATGAMSMIIPADPVTGKLKVFHSLQALLRSDNPAEMAYTISVPDGDYEVGVQTVKNDWTASEFTKAEISISSGIQSAQAVKDETTTVYDVNGVYMGNTTEGLGRGIYIVKQGNKTTKVVK